MEASSVTAPYEITWSNRSGEVLKNVAPDLWVAERPFVWSGIDVGGRMTVARLSDGGLWVHSPVALDEPLRAALAAIGPVAHIVSPNYEHVKWAAQWIDAYPEAASYACPGLREKKPEIAFTDTVGDEAPEAWGGEIDSVFLDCERNPFNGKPFFNEVVFCHVPSGTLITADFWWNWPDEGIPPQTWLWKQGMDRVYAPFYKSLMISDKPAFRARMQRMLSDWEWDAIVPCHGDIVQRGGKAALQALYADTNWQSW